MTFNCAGVGVELRGGELQKTGESVAGSARRHHASEPLTAGPRRGFVKTWPRPLCSIVSGRNEIF